MAAAHEPAPEGACVFFVGGSFWSSIWRVCMAHRVLADRILCFTHVNVGKNIAENYERETERERGRERERESISYTW